MNYYDLRAHSNTNTSKHDNQLIMRRGRLWDWWYGTSCSAEDTANTRPMADPTVVDRPCLHRRRSSKPPSPTLPTLQFCRQTSILPSHSHQPLAPLSNNIPSDNHISKHLRPGSASVLANLFKMQTQEIFLPSPTIMPSFVLLQSPLALAINTKQYEMKWEI